MTTHRTFLGDKEHGFRLSPAMIAELEHVTSSGIGGLCQRLFRGDFRHSEIVQVIRLALIGGDGVTPQQAARVVETYVADRPLAETYPLAVAILETAWFGQAQTVEDAMMQEDIVMTDALMGEAA